ncbi:MAG: hypothetical protein AAF384_03970, partial [Pseudomonadota bacterium]
NKTPPWQSPAAFTMSFRTVIDNTTMPSPSSTTFIPKRFKISFCDPEVARVGINEQEAQAKSINYDVSRYEFDELDRAITDGVNRGFVKVLTAKDSDRILGATIVGEHAGELINEFVLAMKHGLGLAKLLGTIRIYPTMSEANKYLAGTWRRQRISPFTLKLLQRFHAWRRGDFKKISGASSGGSEQPTQTNHQG